MGWGTNWTDVTQKTDNSCECGYEFSISITHGNFLKAGKMLASQE